MSENTRTEEILDGRLVVNVYHGRRSGSAAFRSYEGPLVSIGSIGNRSGSMTLTPIELAALLDGPLERALAAMEGSTS